MRIVNVQEMQEMDRRAIEDIGMPSVVLMENAGRAVSEIALDTLNTLSNKSVAIFCGTGNNGGDGFVAARHLINKGVQVDVYLIGKRANLKKDPMVNFNILEKRGVRIKEIDSITYIDVGLIIDAIFGIGLRDKVREPAKSIIIELNKRYIPILSIDVPSGLNADTGEILGTAIKAHTTVTIQFPKKGFYVNEGLGCTGKVVVADIGIGHL